jgi:hypothetical protein
MLTGKLDAGQVGNLVKKQYGVSYGPRQMQRILRALGLYCYKPQPRDFRQPQKADEKLKERLRAVLDALGLQGKDLEKLSIGFADESAPQIQANSARLWSTRKGVIKKVNTDKKRRNSFGFYALKGKSVIASMGNMLAGGYGIQNRFVARIGRPFEPVYRVHSKGCRITMYHHLVCIQIDAVALQAKLVHHFGKCFG